MLGAPIRWPRCCCSPQVRSTTCVLAANLSSDSFLQSTCIQLWKLVCPDSVRISLKMCLKEFVCWSILPDIHLLADLPFPWWETKFWARPGEIQLGRLAVPSCGTSKVRQKLQHRLVLRWKFIVWLLCWWWLIINTFANGDLELC